ncbi:MAG: hypothetical protein QOJ07_1081, partial [Thermoleophilaceae bacterium]|nr:hypothetical protein [Thermoleophilaceae bacterium]
IMRFDRLGRRLKIGVGVATLAAATTSGGFVAAKLADRRSTRARVRRRLPR